MGRTWEPEVITKDRVTAVHDGHGMTGNRVLQGLHGDVDQRSLDKTSEEAYNRLVERYNEEE